MKPMQEDIPKSFNPIEAANHTPEVPYPERDIRELEILKRSLDFALTLKDKNGQSIRTVGQLCEKSEAELKEELDAYHKPYSMKIIEGIKEALATT